MSRALQSMPKCRDPRRCFAKTGQGLCKCLSQAYPTGKRCPFCKSPESMTATSKYMLMMGKERDAEIYRLKVEEKKSADTLADMFGLSVAHIFEILDAQRKKRRKSSGTFDEREAQIKKARELLTEGKSMTEVSRIMNKPRSTLNTWKARGIL